MESKKNANGKATEAMVIETQTKNQVNLKILTPKPIFVFLTYDGHGLPVAYRLLQEGYLVYVGQAENISEKKEEGKEKERRLKLYDGMIEKIPIGKLVKALLKTQNKEKYFVFTDFSILYEYSEPLLKAGFRGLLPIKEDYLLEENREMAKEFVDENYPAISPKEHHQFSKIEEAIEFLENEENNKVWVLKGFHPDAPTVVPIYDNPEIAKEEIISALQEERKTYEAEGFLLEEKLTEIIEFVPEATSFDGKIVGRNICLEIKDFYPSPRGKGRQTGCTADIDFWLMENEFEEIYNRFLKPLEEKMLRKNVMTIWDCGLIYDKKQKKFFFTEFCIRPGYNALFSELSTLPSVGEYFERLIRGEEIFNPISTHRFGASIRIFNNTISLEKSRPAEVILLDEYGKKTEIVDKDLWLWDVQKKGKNYYTANYDINLAVATGSGNDFKRAFDNAWEKTSQIIMDNAYFINLEDIYSTSYKNNLIERYLFIRNEFNLENLPPVI